MSSPSKIIRPELFLIKPPIEFKMVVFPQPEGPNIHRIFPSSREKLISFKTSFFP